MQYTGAIEVAWLPVGFAAGMLYLGDLRWFAGGMLGDWMVGNDFGLHFPFDGQDLVTTAGNTIEFVLAAYLMRRWLGRRNQLERAGDVARVVAAIGIGTAVSGVIGNLAAVRWGGLHWGDVPTAVRTWWLGDTSGGLLLAPLLLAWGAPPWHLSWGRRQVMEAVGILAAVVGLSVAVFSSHHPVTYLVFPALVVAALYLGQRGATVALVLAYAVAVTMTAANVGPFVETSITDAALSTQLYILIAIVTTLTLGAAVGERRRAAVELAESRRREAERAAQERQRIAADLHDSVSQTLFSLGLHAGIAKHEMQRAELPDRSALPAAIDEVANLAHGALVEMRAAIFELRGGAVAEQGLVAALGAHGAALSVRHDIGVSVEGPRERLPLNPDCEELLFRIGQEAMTNAVKHSGSSSVSVQVELDAEAVVMRVVDQGTGFDPSRAYGGHLGMELMRSRAAQAGGSVQVDSSSHTGTTIRVRVPANATVVAPRQGLPESRPARPVSVN